ncbi:MAG TPA: hypothetical protein VMD48_07780 [Solirubrobacteraceae bacterium]|nr:hypothetical protein [Solirubrobacteraceae bacterium]
MIGALMLAGCGGSSSPQLPHRSAPLVSIFEAGPQLLADPAGTLDTLRSLGVDIVKVFVPWNGIAPDPDATTEPVGFDGSDPAAYPAANWAPYDAIVRDASARGINVDLTLSEPPPLWARGAGAPRGAGPQWEPSETLFGQFVTAVGTRYGGHYTPAGASSPLPRVRMWSIWNEPNYGPDLKPQAIDHWQIPVSPALYRGLVNAAWSALHATGHGHDTILIGELAPRGIPQADGMVPLRFVRAMYCLGPTLEPLRGAAAVARACPPTAAGSARFKTENPALFEASGFSDHPYPQGEVPPNFVTTGEADYKDYADFASLPKLIATLDRAQQVYGSSKRFSIWSTEFGYNTNPPRAEEASPAVASGLLNWSEYLTWLNPRIRSYDQYQLVDPPTSPDSQFDTGLEFSSGKPKAVYAAFRMPIWLPHTGFSPGAAIEVWGCVRPARFAGLDTHAVQYARIEFARGTSTRFTTLTTIKLTNPYGYFDVAEKFPGSGRVRLAWAYPHGAQIFSRVVSVSAR